MTADEFESELDRVREIVTGFLTALPPDMTIGEALKAVKAEKPSTAEVECAYHRLKFGHLD